MTLEESIDFLLIFLYVKFLGNETWRNNVDDIFHGCKNTFTSVGGEGLVPKF
jgi:hypothetical protein